MERMKRHRPWQVGAFVSLTIASLIGAGLARAADDPNVLFPECDKTDNIEAAKIAHRAAMQLFEREEWDRAIENWRDAYKLDCKAHGVLINAASAYEKKGDIENAVAMLEAYLRRAPTAADAPNIIQKIETLRTSLPVRTATPTASAVPSATPTVTATVSAPPPPLPPPQRPYGAIPWMVVGGGAAAVLVGAILVPVGRGAISDAEAACGGRSCTKSQASIASDGNAGRTKVIAGDVTLGVGIAAIGGGLFWQFAMNKPRLMRPTEPTSDGAPPAAAKGVSVAPMAGPSVIGITASGRF